MTPTISNNTQLI